MEKSPARHRWFQYSLRTLLIVMTILAAWCAWWSHKARQQRNAVKALKPYSVHYDFEVANRNAPRYWPGWLVNTLGRDYFASIEAIAFREDVTDDDLIHLERLAGLKQLDFWDDDISDSGLVHLKGLKELEELYLWYTKVSDNGLKHIRDLPALQVLDLDGTNVTDAGLDQLSGMSSLQSLYVSDTRVTDAGVERLQKALPNCKIVH